LKSISLSFKSKSIEFSRSQNCKINFEKLVEKLTYFDNWIDIDIEVANDKSEFKISFK
jgi:hypothetical protein